MNILLKKLLQKFLLRFGYLEDESINPTGLRKDDPAVNALVKYQLYNGCNASGKHRVLFKVRLIKYILPGFLDERTLMRMNSARCANRDFGEQTQEELLGPAFKISHHKHSGRVKRYDLQGPQINENLGLI